MEGSSQDRTGIALSLSGGGYRAMVFHLGAIWRLNQAGLLSKLTRVCSVSGGSITAGALALWWRNLAFDADGVAQRLDIFIDEVRKFAHVTVDAGAIIGGILLPGTINDRVVSAYDKHLFHHATLQDLPSEGPGTPRFCFLATNIQTGALWRFQKCYMGDYHVGLLRDPAVPLAFAVAASSAFPPVLSPAVLKLNTPFAATQGADLQRPPFTTHVTLSDGGVYDNLGLEPTKGFRTVLVSDAGQKMSPEPEPAHNWAQHSIRVMEVIDNQVRSLRKRHLIDAFKRGDYAHGDPEGAYWGIRTDFAGYEVSDPLGCLSRNPNPLAAIPTRLQAMDDSTQEMLINWGYAICDAALRKYGASLVTRYGAKIAEPDRFPYPRGY
ncbi:MAG: patatin-like phospholipase family protein [Planctomycetota bacterium]|nr:patatin-like phospholipase family protein [Planctomycetota bacterium]